VRPDTPLVGLQLGASKSVRRWPAASFIAVAKGLQDRLGARVVLCGGGGDRPVAEEIGGALGALAVDLCGRTSINELGALLARTDVLVTGDTGPMHMAVAVGTPVVSLFFGPALPFDTGPYAADHVCLHADVACAPCDHNVTCLQPFCRETLPPDAVVEAVVARRAGDWAAIDAAAARWTGFGWYRTAFDAEGLFEARRLGPPATSAGETLRQVYRALWKAELEGTTPVVTWPPQPSAAAAAQAVVAVAADARADAERIEALARDASDVDALEAAAQRLETLDDEVMRLGAIHEPAALLTQVLRFDKENIVGDDVHGLAVATRALHETLHARAERLALLLDGRSFARRRNDARDAG
jgi:hypothetical protein